MKYSLLIIFLYVPFISFSQNRKIEIKTIEDVKRELKKIEKANNNLKLAIALSYGLAFGLSCSFTVESIREKQWLKALVYGIGTVFVAWLANTDYQTRIKKEQILVPRIKSS